MPDPNLMKRPNFLVFCTDQQRADYLGCAGHPLLRTPNLDALAARGTRFASAYTPSPVCMCARGALLTGETNRGNNMGRHGMGLPEDMPTLPGTLAAAGYRTHSVGKLHLKPWGDPKGVPLEAIENPEDNPERRRFWSGGEWRRSPENYYGFQTQDMVIGHGHYAVEGGDYAVWLERESPGAGRLYDKRKADDWALDIEPRLHYNNWIADRSIDFINTAGREEAPFYLWCSFPDPHNPFTALREWAERYPAEAIDLTEPALAGPEPSHIATLARLRTMAGHPVGKPRDPEALREITRHYLGMISHIDEQVGRVLANLEARGLAENTVVVFLSDHGEELGDHGLMFKGLWPYDGSQRVPLLMHVPGGPEGRVVDDVVSLLDFVPTIYDLAGVPQPDDPRLTDAYREVTAPLPAPLPGESLAPVVREGVRPQRRSALIELDDDFQNDLEQVSMRTFVRNDYKLASYSPTGELFLFDRRTDPHERNNLAEDPAHAGVVREMLAGLLHELNRTEPRTPRRFSPA